MLPTKPDGSGEEEDDVAAQELSRTQFLPGENDHSQESHSCAKIFISYDHKDNALHEKLRKHLSPLEREGKIRIWDDLNIAAGDEPKKKIDVHLKEADIILLLVSPDFLAAQDRWDGVVQPALERHKAGTVRVIPIILNGTSQQG